MHPEQDPPAEHDPPDVKADQKGSGDGFLRAGACCDPAAAQLMWDALNSARAGETLTGQVAVEDEIFRFYLPMARSAAADYPATNRDPAAMLSAAELGLSHAILAWQQRDSADFDRFARASIAGHLRLLTGRPRGGRAGPEH